MTEDVDKSRGILNRLMGSYTSIHIDRDTYFRPQFEIQRDFTDKMIFLSSFKMLGKCALITFASAGFGVMMGFIMSSFEFNRQMTIDTDRSTRSQLKQQFFGYGRFLKRQALGFMKFGFYISLIEIPLELAMGKITAPAMLFSGGMAAVLLEFRGTFGSKVGRFFSSGLFIGLLGLYVNKGNDRA